MPEPSVFEVERAIGKLKGHKSPGTDQIPVELIKARGRKIRPEIYKFINSIWKKEELPEQWKESITVPIYKKGHKQTTEIIEARHCSQLHTKLYPASCCQG